ncbi:MAG: HAD-IIA family hydrolase [Micromonosporaceae bacterium]|jgi:HAD superfamily hydrolase (TIGR01450 family)|nr:HAD-IIA family hydrolase [Micromonosporaceae bacterium]
MVAEYDLVILDLDGVVYLIDRPIPSAVEAIRRLHRDGQRLAYATNNASRRAADVATLLCGMGIEAAAAEVLTSAQASASLLAQRLPAGSPVLVVGAEALRAEIRDAGLRPVGSADEGPAAVVQGYGPEVGWADLAEAAVAIRAGAVWVATNTDRTLPTARGPVPGNGALVAALRTALERDPDLVVGKPEPALFETAAQRAGARRPIVVGDRLDTDIEGARRSGMDSLLVLTGVSGARDLLAAPPDRRPSHLAADLSGLFEVDEAVRVPSLDDGSDGAEAGGWRVTRREAGLALAGSGQALPALRLLCAVAWAGEPVQRVTADSPAAAEVLRRLALDQ